MSSIPASPAATGACGVARELFAPLADGCRLGLGTAPLGNLFTAVSEKEADAMLDAALDEGCRTFDTAPHYGNGLSEHRLGRALRGAQGIILSTKVGRILRPDASAPRAQHGYVDVLQFSQHFDYSRAGTRRSVEDSLQRLGRSRIEVAYVHDCCAVTHGDRAEAVLRQVIGETLPELRQLQREGLVGAIGLGVNEVAVVRRVLAEADLDALMLAGRYSLLDHEGLDHLLPECAARGVQVALGGVFNSGILATGVRAGAVPTFNYAPAASAWIERTAAIEAVCGMFGVPLRAAALQFPLAHEAVRIVMVGARSLAEWRDCVAMARHAIPAAFWSALRERGLLPPHAPVPA